ncbi:expressed conserved protein [Echinococcus multilocularis]|uniref:Expressed conserved protein n=1 Tax=Echinococcus multilocularis TaxID=6211 RepID=A0A087VYP2_ECHMU|nr:expressed conserved protein [Echinococcus multilocularis]
MAYGPESRNFNDLIPRQALFQSVDEIDFDKAALIIKRDEYGQPLPHAEAVRTRGKSCVSRSVPAYPSVREKTAHRLASLDSDGSTSRSDSLASSASSFRRMGRSPPRRRFSRSQVRRTPPRNMSSNYSIDRMLSSSPYMQSEYPEAHYERAPNRAPTEINGEPVYYRNFRLEHLAKVKPRPQKFTEIPKTQAKKTPKHQPKRKRHGHARRSSTSSSSSSSSYSSSSSPSSSSRSRSSSSATSSSSESRRHHKSHGRANHKRGHSSHFHTKHTALHSDHSNRHHSNQPTRKGPINKIIPPKGSKKQNNTSSEASSNSDTPYPDTRGVRNNVMCQKCGRQATPRGRAGYEVVERSHQRRGDSNVTQLKSNLKNSRSGKPQTVKIQIQGE